jgi:hypothetical protein
VECRSGSSFSGHKPEQHSGTLFPSIDITNNPHFDQLCVTMHPGNFFLITGYGQTTWHISSHYKWLITVMVDVLVMSY